ncbi:MAG TPA: hypothetical protein VNK45_09635, partial [Candidatus Acidoferrales bacterium]|nr:hypothetical protein [Candidatus Acidoferrales bacterium]
RQRANDRPNNPQSSQKSARIARGSLRSEFGHRQAHCLAILMFSVSLVEEKADLAIQDYDRANGQGIDPFSQRAGYDGGAGQQADDRAVELRPQQPPWRGRRLGGDLVGPEGGEAARGFDRAQARRGRVWGGRLIHVQ